MPDVRPIEKISFALGERNLSLLKMKPLSIGVGGVTVYDFLTRQTAT